MNVKESSGDLIWYWNKKPIKLKYLHYNQLDSIKKTLLTSKKYNNNWFGHSKDHWLNAIKSIEKSNNKKNTNEAKDIIINNRIKNATLKANYLTNIIINANNKNNK